MATTWDKTLFDLAYDTSGEPMGHPNTRPEIRLHYHRYALTSEMLRRAQFFVQQFGLSAASSVIVIGAGFGWTLEALQGMGIPCVGTDVGAFIQGNKGLTEDAELAACVQTAGLDPASGEGLAHFQRLGGGSGFARCRTNVMNEDCSTASSRQRVKQALTSGNLTICITEDVVTSLTDTECVSLRTNAAKFGVPLCHFVTELANPNPPFGFNSKTLAQWKALFPNDTIVADGNPYRVA